MFFICFPFLSYPIRPNTTTSIGYTKPHAEPSQSNLSSTCKQIIIPYGSNTLPIKKPELLITTSLSSLANTVNSNSIFNTKYAKFSKKWFVFLHFQNPTCVYNRPYNLHQKSIPLLQSTFTTQLLTLLVHKIILIIPTVTSFLYTFLCVQPSQQSTEKYFSCLSYSANSGCLKGPGI